MCNYKAAKEQAQALGAVKVGVYSTKVRLTFGETRTEAFTSHFFDVGGLEIGYYHHMLGELSTHPLTIMEPRRVWGEEMLSKLAMSDVPPPFNPKP